MKSWSVPRSMRLDIAGFYFITDSGYTRQGALKDAGDAIRGGASVVQYREKSKSFPERAAEALEILKLCRNAGVPFIVNDDIELALAMGADGLHIGPHDMPLAEARRRFPAGIIGVSCGSVEEVVAATGGGADYIAASPVFFTPTKSFAGYNMPEPLGLEGVSAFRKATGLPMVAIGGINMGNVREVVKAGADMVCAISATVGTRDVEASVRGFAEAVAQAR